ncbi:Ribokinase [Rubripirellula tenax]|uniref:Ribokinase n=1 Tax=Rubripirellula tenax TaxID=2528015 RepID=A0A5C6EYF5_9BACT|nr:ribokinase [Rubripirellula tenax]TWU54673.1 Ribokinase [Rubripirellula tenax]
MNTRAAKIVVLGSINMDLVIRCKHLSRPGETIIARSSDEVPGGKGANQAVAAARAGGDVTMIGRIGDDAFSNRLMDNLIREKVSVDTVIRTPETASGLAVVAVDDVGENSIMVVPGANAMLSVNDVHMFADQIGTADVMMVQLEVPHSTVLAAIEVARRAGVRVALDPAPMPACLGDGFLTVDVVCPNQTEAESIVGHAIETVEDAKRATAAMHRRGARNVILTLGGRGAVVSDGADFQWIDATPVTVVDTTAAGDAFAGALAVRLAEDADVFTAARFASVAGAIAATRLGAQPGLPTRPEIENLLNPQML